MTDSIDHLDFALKCAIKFATIYYMQDGSERLGATKTCPNDAVMWMAYTNPFDDQASLDLACQSCCDKAAASGWVIGVKSL